MPEEIPWTWTELCVASVMLSPIGGNSWELKPIWIS